MSDLSHSLIDLFWRYCTRSLSHRQFLMKVQLLQGIQLSRTDYKLISVIVENWSTVGNYSRCIDDSSANNIAPELGHIWNPQVFVQNMTHQFQELLPHCSDPVLKDFIQILGNYYPSIQTARSISTMSRGSEFDSQRASLLSSLQGSCQSFIRFGQQHSCPQISALGILFQAELFLLVGENDQALEKISLAQHAFLEAQLPLGNALCHMLEGDLYSAPLSRPEWWNIAGVNQALDQPLAWETERFSFTHPNQDLKQAQKKYEMAEAIFEAHTARVGKGLIQLRKGFLCVLENKYHTLFEHLSKAKDYFEQADAPDMENLCLAHRALGYLWSERLSEGIPLVQTIGKWGNSDGSYSIAFGLGKLFQQAGNYWLKLQVHFEKALAAYRHAEFLFAELGAWDNHARSLLLQAETYQLMGYENSAIPLYEQTLEIRKQAHKHGFPEQPGQFSEPIQQMLSIYQVREDADGLAHIIQRIEEIMDTHESPGFNSMMEALLSGKREEAIAGGMLSQVNQMMLAFQLEPAKVNIPWYRAKKLFRKGKEAEAEPLFQEALLLAGQMQNPPMVHLMQASILGSQKKYEESLQHFTAYWTAVFEPLIYQRPDPNDGSQTSIWNQQVSNLHEQALAYMVRVKAYGRAIYHANELEQMRGKGWWSLLEKPWNSLADLAEAYEGLEQYSRALQYYEAAVNNLENRRSQINREALKTQFSGEKDVQYIYFMSTRACLKMILAGNALAASQAFRYAEMGKSRALLDMMTINQQRQREISQNPQYLSWRELNTRMDIYRKELAELYKQPKIQRDSERLLFLKDAVDQGEFQLYDLEKIIMANQPRLFSDTWGTTSPLTLLEVQSLLQPGQLILQYYYVDDEFLAWALPYEGDMVPHFSPKSSHLLDGLIEQFVQECSYKQAYSHIAQQLSEILLSPFSGIMDSHTHLIFIPYGQTHRLPFHALPIKGEALTASWTISYLPSASSLKFLHSKKRTTQTVSSPSHNRPKILSIGNPTLDLPAAEMEATYVAHLFDEHTLLIGNDATEERVRRELPHYPWIHMATHGEFNPESPLEASILLAGGDRLTVYELMGVQLDAQLVVLSACETGQGEATKGDDILGLTRGLLAAGARSAIVSLWPVDDVATSLFMQHFYQHLSHHNQPIIALHSAQEYLRSLSIQEANQRVRHIKNKLRSAGKRSLELEEWDHQSQARDYSHPFYWAPFVLIGG